MQHTRVTTLAPDHVLGPDVDLAPPEASRLQSNGHPRTKRWSPGSLARRLISEGGLVFLIVLACYIVVSVFLDLKYKTFEGDAVSRMANGYYVFYSRDPHLAAIGFVWDPLTSLADMVFLLGNDLWPALAHNDMAGSLTSAFSMAAAVYQLLLALKESGVARAPRLVLTTFFALDPMILLYSGDGMSEGLYLFTLIAATRYLLRWMNTGQLRSLAYAATALGFSYLTRNEAAASVIAGGLAVFFVSYRRATGDRLAKRAAAMADATIFAIPGVIAAVGWAVASYVITGQFFAQYSSIYGSSSQEAHLGHESLHGREIYIVHAVATMWPLLPFILVAAIIVAIRRKDPRILAPLTVLGAALGFDALALLNNNIQPDYRYFIVTIPIEVLLLGSLIGTSPLRRARRRLGPRSVLWRLRNLGAILLVVVTMVPAVVTTAAAMFNPNLGPEELELLAVVFVRHPTQFELTLDQQYPDILHIGAYLAQLKLPNGDVLVDNAVACVPNIITTISQPKLFVIPNNRDFQRVLADPPTFHDHYILEASPSSSPETATNILYPGLWANGGGFSKRVHTFPALGDCPEFRLFKVTKHPNQAH
jgi:hypothetical protein